MRVRGIAILFSLIAAPTLIGSAVAGGSQTATIAAAAGSIAEFVLLLIVHKLSPSSEEKARGNQ